MSLILCCGDRNWTDEVLIKKELRQFIQRTTILTGGCRGADYLCDKVAKDYGMPTLIMNADWQQYGKAAGPLRNLAMLRMSPSLVLAFHDNITESKGTKHCVTEALKMGIKVRIITHG